MSEIQELADQLGNDATNLARNMLEMELDGGPQLTANERDAVEAGIQAGIAAAMLVLQRHGLLPGGSA